MIIGQFVELSATQRAGATIPYINTVRVASYYYKTSDSRTHVGFIALVHLAERCVGILNCTFQQRDVFIFIKWLRGFVCLFASKWASQQFTRHAFCNKSDSHAAGNLTIVVTSQPVSNNKHSHGFRDRFVNPLEHQNEGAILVRLATPYVTGV